MTNKAIASQIEIRRRYTRSVDIARDADDPDSLEGYEVTPSIRDATLRVLAGLSSESRQRAFRVVGPYGTGKSAFGVFLARLLGERGQGQATTLLKQANGVLPDVPLWRPVPVSGRRVSFSRDLLQLALRSFDQEQAVTTASLQKRIRAQLRDEVKVDAMAVIELLAEAAAMSRSRTGEGVLLLVDEMGRFLEYAILNNQTEDPSIFQALAERAGGAASPDLAVVGFLHHRFIDYVAGMGKWAEAEWARSAERYEEVSFGNSTEQSLFMLSRAIKPCKRHSTAVRRKAERIYTNAVERDVFVVSLPDIVKIASNLYPLHPASVATLASAFHRFGQNERSLFSFLQSLEPASLKRFAQFTPYGAENWYRLPLVFDHLAATISESPWRERSRRWSLAFDALAGAERLTLDHQDVLKAIALVSVLEPVPGLVASIEMIAWSLGKSEDEVQELLDGLSKRKLIYRRPHRFDYSLWSSSSIDLSRWLDEAKTNVPVPERLEEITSLLPAPRRIVAHRHYHETGTLRTFEIKIWSGTKANSIESEADGLILVVPIYPNEDRDKVLRSVTDTVADDPLVLVCGRAVAPEDLKWAYELALWTWVRANCAELKVDELARTEVEEHIAAARQAMIGATFVLSSSHSMRGEEWWIGGKPTVIPTGGLSAILSEICDEAFDQAPILRNELINRNKLSTAVAAARTRLLDRMLNYSTHTQLGMVGTPPERTIYLSLLHASGIHREDSDGNASMRSPEPRDPQRWGPVWKRISAELETGRPVSVAELMEILAVPPFGVRSGPALLVIAAFVLASKENVIVMERNTFQPDLTAAHFARLVKAPSRFALKSHLDLREQQGIIRALAANLQVLSSCQPTISAVTEKFYSWYNSLPLHASKTTRLSPTAVAVRTTIRKASEPHCLFFQDLPMACGVERNGGPIDVDLYIKGLDNALAELDRATPELRSLARQATFKAFGVTDLETLRSQVQQHYEPHLQELHDHRLRVLVERAINTDTPPDRWLDGIAGHVTGRRPDNWDDDTLKRFRFEINVAVRDLKRWLLLLNSDPPGSPKLTGVHIVGRNGQQKMVVVDRDGPNPHLAEKLKAVRCVLDDGPEAIDVLGQLIAEYADRCYDQKAEEMEVDRA